MMKEYLLGELQEVVLIPLIPKMIMNFRKKIIFQSDRKGTVDTGPKSWATSAPAEEGGWKSWIVPIVLALASSVVYRMYFSK